MTRMTRDVDKIKLDVSGKKKLMKRTIDSLHNEIEAMRVQIEGQRADRDKLRADLDKLTELEKALEITSPYRKILANVVNKTSELNSLMSGITNTGSYYERVVELSEVEQVKIMEKILREDEESLKGDSILKDIVDRERFRSIVKSFIRIFSVPNYPGLADNYRSDLIWATVGIPPGLWDQELQGALSSTLNVYSSVEASKSISVRQIPQMDPWTITFLVIMAKARVDQIEKFPSMKNDMEGVQKSERLLFRSFLLEQGVTNLDDVISKFEERRTTQSSKEREA
jgi:hypothetical protein